MVISKNMYSTRQSEKGFTLAEVLVTMALVGVLSVSVLSLFKESSIKQRRLMQKVAALHFAQAGMESVVADKQRWGFDRVKQDRYKINRFNGIKREIKIDSVSDGLKKILVVVDWADYSDSLVSFIGNY